MPLSIFRVVCKLQQDPLFCTRTNGKLHAVAPARTEGGEPLTFTRWQHTLGAQLVAPGSAAQLRALLFEQDWQLVVEPSSTWLELCPGPIRLRRYSVG
eukprot:862737-Alexandrium_andersonii.AAC.1